MCGAQVINWKLALCTKYSHSF